MKRFALLLGNNRGPIGVPLDIEAYRSFLTSPEGGAWKQQEIQRSYDLTKEEFRKMLEGIKKKSYDYFLFVFSGHGGIDRTTQETILELSPGEEIEESILNNIASCQLSIFDCCRDYGAEEVIQANYSGKLIKESAYYDLPAIRRIYDTALYNAPKFHHRVYACQIGECAEGSYSSGGRFSQSFLKMAKTLAVNTDEKLVYLDDCFLRTCISCATDSQHPDANIPKSRYPLPWAVNKNVFSLSEDICGGFLNPIFAPRIR